LFERLDLGDRLVNHPKDPGGLTNFGISQRSYPALNIREITRDDAKKSLASPFSLLNQWFPGRDSNPHDLRRRILNPTLATF